MGNAAFVRDYASSVRSSWRVHRSDDLVPEVPPGKSYVHVPHAVRLDPERQVVMMRHMVELQPGSVPVTGAVRVVSFPKPCTHHALHSCCRCVVIAVVATA